MPTTTTHFGKFTWMTAPGSGISSAYESWCDEQFGLERLAALGDIEAEAWVTYCDEILLLGLAHKFSWETWLANWCKQARTVADEIGEYLASCR